MNIINQIEIFKILARVNSNNKKLTNIILFEIVSITVLIFLKYFGVSKSINKGSLGLKNPEIMEMLGFGPSHNKTKILLDQN